MSKKAAPNQSTGRQSTALDRHIGQRLRLARQLGSVSQERLGEELGITFQQIQKYERGANRVSASRLHLISRFFGRPIGFFYEGYKEEPVDVVPTSPAERELAEMGFHSPALQAAITSLSQLPKPVQKAIIGLIHDLEDDQDAAKTERAE